MRQILEKFLDEIRVYVRESGTNIAHDDRESSEFVDVFARHNPELFPLKRDPLPDGTLPLSKDELREFNGLYCSKVISRIYLKGEFVYMQWNDIDIPVTNYKAILWLVQHFNLWR